MNIRSYRREAPPVKRKVCALLDYLVGEREDGRRDRNAQRRCRLDVHDQFVAGRLLDRQITGSLALQDFVDIGGSAAEEVVLVWTKGQKAPAPYALPPQVHRRQFIASRELYDLP